jgi:hypothetical protein
MISVIFTNKANRLQHVLQAPSGASCAVVRMLYDQQTPLILETLKQGGISYEIIAGQNYIQRFQDIYARFIGALNIRYAGLHWWALDLTNKNPITTRLFDAVYYTLLLETLIANGSFETIIVISEDKDCCQQLQMNHANNDNVQISDQIVKTRVKKFLQQCLPLGPMYKCLWALSGKLWAAWYLPPRKARLKTIRYFVLSLLYRPCFKTGDYQDVYFGPFVEFLAQQDIPFVNVMEVCAPYRQMMKETRDKARHIAVYPKESFLSVKHIFVCLLECLKAFYSPIRLDDPCEVAGVACQHLVRTYIRYEYISTRYCANLLMFYAFKDIAGQYPGGTIYYPFENRSFEKMVISAVRQQHKPMTLIAYQHASATLRHTNFLLAEGEARALPLPDRIYTLGAVTQRFLVEQGGFPKELLTEGCALRQKAYTGAVKKRPAQVRRLLVALATNIEEYVKALLFLSEAFEAHQGEYEVWVRPHPVYSLDDALAITGPLSFKFHKADQESLADSFQWADLLLFVHSMVAIEGLMYGLPCLRLVVDNPVDPDPLLGWADFKWDVGEPKNVVKTIASIEALSDNEFYSQQEQGCRFPREYMRPVTKAFLNTLLTGDHEKNP